jgi:hypothetical protein
MKQPSYNRDILKIIHNKYGISIDYIRKSIRGDRMGAKSSLIKSEYDRLYNETIKVLEDYSEKK